MLLEGVFEFQNRLDFTVKQLETLKTSGLVVHKGWGVGWGGYYRKILIFTSLYIRTLSQSGLIILHFTTLKVVFTTFFVTFVKVLNPSIIGL